MNKSDLNASVLMPNLMILLLVAIGLVSDQAPLLSGRPNESRALKNVADVPARLWQDPLGFVAPDGAPSELPIKPNEAVLVLPVLLNSSAYAEETETRLRSRYAVLSALSRAQYVPVAPDRMRFVASGGTTSQANVPFEELEVRHLVTDGVEMTGRSAAMPAWLTQVTATHTELSIPTPYTKIFVLWLDENALSRGLPGAGEDRKPFLITGLDALLKKIVPAKPGRAAIRIIGPTNSDELVELAEPHKATVADGVLFLSPRATAAREVIQISARPLPEAARTDPFTEQSWPVYRTITPDDRLVDTLLEELKRRNVSPDDRHDIVLVGEWDTLYSRGLGRTFAAKLNTLHLKAEPQKQADALQQPAVWAANPRYFHEFSYLRGLDGRLPKEAASKSTVEKSASSTENAKESGTLLASAGGEKVESSNPRATEPNRSTGQSQFDYLRRLEDRLLALQADLRRGPVERGVTSEIAAIGIVGSDVYDKLLVLRALRKSFPRAIFFTTDLDASYLDREEREWTRNLLIVAPHGLRATDHLQGRTPPFRDSYQTALYLTILQAVGVARVDGETFSVVVNPVTNGFVQPPSAPPTPRIFEIGRSQIFDLSMPPGKPAGGIYPPPHREFFGNWWSPATLLALASAGLAIFLWCWCIRSSFEFRAQGKLVSFPDSTLRYLLRMTFGVVWFTATTGAVTGLAYVPTRWPASSLPPAARAAVLLVAAIGYGWIFYRVLMSAHEPKPDYWKKPLNILAWVLGGAFVLGGVALLTRAVWVVARYGGEEPFAFFDGVSMWPTDIVRALAIVFSLHFIFRTQWHLSQLKNKIADTHDLCRPSQPQCQHGQLGRDRFRFWKWPETFWLARQPSTSAVPADASAPPVIAGYPDQERSLWIEYCKVTTIRARFPRIAIYMILYFGFFLGLGTVLGQPFTPGRGAWSRALDTGVLTSAVLVYTYLLFYVFDATILAAEFTKRLSGFLGENSYLGDCQAVHLVNDLVGVVSKLIYLPFSVLFMLIASRNSLFDRWDWPPVLLGIFGFGLLLIVIASMRLQRAATQAKNDALLYLDRMSADLVKKTADASLIVASLPQPGSDESGGAAVDTAPAAVVGPAAAGTATAALPGAEQVITPFANKAGPTLEQEARRMGMGAGRRPFPLRRIGPRNEILPLEGYEADAITLVDSEAVRRRKAEIEELRRQIEEFNDVAFRDWHHNPIFRAVLIPLGGIGSLQVLEKVVSALPQ